jgi:NADH-quinone oxidoreductase subunit M
VNTHFGYPLLWALQVVPLLGAVGVFLLHAHPRAVLVSRIVAIFELLLAVQLLTQIDATSSALQLIERLDLYGFTFYHAGADGVTVLFILLNALLTLLLSFYGLVQGHHNAGRIAVMVLAAEALLMSMLVTLNVLWFAFASFAELVVVAHLLGRWSTSTEENRALAMARFIQFQGVGGAMLLVSIGILGWGHADATGRWSFDLLDLMRVPPQG